MFTAVIELLCTCLWEKMANTEMMEEVEKNFF